MQAQRSNFHEDQCITRFQREGCSKRDTTGYYRFYRVVSLSAETNSAILTFPCGSGAQLELLGLVVYSLISQLGQHKHALKGLAYAQVCRSIYEIRIGF